MAVLKVACPKCGQKVSGDDSFFGTSVECPVCTSKIAFPDKPGTDSASPPKEEPLPQAASSDSDAASTPPPEKELLEETSSIRLSPRRTGSDGYEDFAEESSPVLGVISMVVGIITVLCLCLPGIVLGPIAVICGHMGVSRSKNSPVRPAPGESMALIGLILGYVGMAVSLVYLIMLAFPDLPQSVRSWLSGTEA